MISVSTKLMRVAASLLALAALSSCSDSVPVAPDALTTSSIAPYRLDSGDRLRITVFDQSGMTGTYNVDQAGDISFPLIGTVPARGKTASQVEKIIAAKLRRGYVKDPDVSIQIDQYRSIYVMGEVGQSGQYTYVPGMTAQNAIAAAGGFSPRALHENVDLTRKVHGESITGRVPLDDPIMAGDTIYVRERLF